MTEHDPDTPDVPEEETGDEEEIGDESALDEMRGSGVGVEDPNIVGDPTPGIVDAQVAEDEPPEV